MSKTTYVLENVTCHQLHEVYGSLFFTGPYLDPYLYELWAPSTHHRAPPTIFYFNLDFILLVTSHPQLHKINMEI